MLAWVLLPLTGGVLGGGLLATSGNPIGPLLVASAGCALLVASAWSSGQARVAYLALAAGGGLSGTLGAYHALPLASDHLAHRCGHSPIAVEGVVVANAPRGERRALLVRALAVETPRGAAAASGLLAVTIGRARRTWPVGARVRLRGKLRCPRNFGNPGGYDARGALARRGVHVTVFLWNDATVELRAAPPLGLRAWIAAHRARVEERVQRIPEPAVRGYLDAVLIGADGAVDGDLRRVLTRTGLAHVVSVSGFHVAAVAASVVLVLGAVLGWVPALTVRGQVAKLAAAGGVLPVLLYGALAGDSVPALRAMAMYLVALAAQLVDRPTDGMRSLAAAALALALGNPGIAADASFELSFVSVVALIVASRRLGVLARTGSASGDGARRASGARGGWNAEAVRQIARRAVLLPLAVSSVVAAATAPLTAYHFQQVSLIAPVANLLTLPLLGPAVLLPGLAALPVVTAWPGAADLLLQAAAAAAGLGLRIARALAALPGVAVATPKPSVLELVLCYAVLLLPSWTGGTGAAGVRAAWRRRAMALVLLAAVADGSYWMWERVASRVLRVTFLSVGQGDAAVVELPGGGVMVIDAGGMPGGFDTGERLIAPFLRARKIMRIDVLVLSHPQLDHYGGMATLVEQFRPREFWWNGVRSTAAAYGRLESALAAAGTRSVALTRDAAPRRMGLVGIEVLHPGSRPGSNPNAASLVLRLTHGAVSVLFAGDVEGESEAGLVASGRTLTGTVLKVPHHGSATSSTPAFLAGVGARVAVISVGADNRFGFPARAALRRLAAAGSEVWRTDRDGAVRVDSYGDRIAVRATVGTRVVRIADLNSRDPFGSSGRLP